MSQKASGRTVGVPQEVRKIRAALTTGPTILFLGSGPSCALGGPSWEDLRQAVIKEAVPPPKQASALGMDWWRLMRFTCDILKERERVEKIIRTELKGAAPAAWFLELMLAPWSCTYTTNFDDVCVRLNEMAGAKARFEEFVGGRLPGADEPGKPVVKIMGSASHNAGDPGAMVLSEADRTMRPSAKHYRKALHHLREAIADGANLVVLGQSLEDGVLDAILADMHTMQEAKPAGKLFYVNPTPPAPDLAMLLDALGVDQIRATGEQLAAGIAGVEPPLAPAKYRTVRVQKARLAIGENVMRYFTGTGVLLDAEGGSEDVRSPQDFIARSAFSRKAFEEGWDFKRSIVQVSRSGTIQREDCSATDVVRELRAPEGRASALLEGGPGCAKTMTAMRIAHEWIAQGGLVVFVNLKVHRNGGDAVHAALEALQAEIDAHSDLSADSLKPGILVIMDNVGRRLRTLHRFWARDGERPLRPYKLLVTARPSEGRALEDRFTHVWSLDRGLTAAERLRLPEYVRSLRSRITDADIQHVISTSTSYWESIYRLVEPSQRPLEQGVVALVQAMDPWEQETAIHAAYCEALGVPLPVTLYSRLENEKNRTELREEVARGHLGEVVHIDSRRASDCLGFQNETAAGAVLAHWSATRPVFHLVGRIIEAIQEGPEEEMLAPVLRAQLGQHDTDLPPLVVNALPITDRVGLMGRLADAFPNVENIVAHARMLRLRRDFEEADRRLEAAHGYAQGPSDERRIRWEGGVIALKWGRRLAEMGEAADAGARLATAKRVLVPGPGGMTEPLRGLQAELLELEALLEEDVERAIALQWDAFQQARHSRNMASTPRSRSIADTLVQRLQQQLNHRNVTREKARKLARDFRNPGAYHVFLEDQVLPPRWHEASREKLAEAEECLQELLSLIPENALALESMARVKLLLDPASQDIPALLEALERAGEPTPSRLLGAFRAACLGAEGAMRTSLRDLRAKAPDFIIPAARRYEFVLRDADGPLRFEVRGGSPNWVQAAGRVPVRDYPPGEEVWLLMGLDGLMAVEPQGPSEK